MNERHRLMIKVAKLYYENGMTQEMIADRLRMSRPRVSRLMQEALDQGIVKISIVQEPGSYAELERELEKRYGLLEVTVIDTPASDSYEGTARDLGPAAAEYFNRVVKDGDVVGLTWGITLAAMVENLLPEKKHNCVVVQMVGGLGEPSAESHATGLVGRTSMAIGAALWLMPTPGIVTSIEAARLLRSDRYVAQVLDKARQVNVAFVAIGAPTQTSLLMRGESIISWSEMNQLIARGAVGDIALHFYDLQGNPIETDLKERVIGISLEELKSIGRVVGVAGGVDKFNAILGAIRGKFINTLITDAEIARRLLEVP
jgi:DNA-binding transcriptional regulator LsrR (DeoR family)